MLEQTFKGVALAVAVSFLLPGCAHYSKSARQQRAYLKYVQKQSGVRRKMQAKVKKPRMPKQMGVSEAHITTQVYNGPQSVTSDQQSTGQ
jgi:hypothetical protein